jgi:predicted Zn-dependent protease
VKLTKDELKWVEAHELAHIMLKHTKDRNDDDEIAADMFAIILLKDKGYDKAAQLVEDKFLERHKRKL